MLMKRVCQPVANSIFSKAMNNVDSLCVFWHHQPKVPEGIKEMKQKIEAKNKIDKSV